MNIEEIEEIRKRNREPEQIYIWYNEDPETHRGWNSYGWYMYVGYGTSYCLDEYRNQIENYKK